MTILGQKRWNGPDVDDTGHDHFFTEFVEPIILVTVALREHDVYDPARPGCLVLDVRMPGISGLELQQRLTDMESTLPIIFVTAHGDIPMAVEAVKAGAVDFIQKPFRDQELLDKIQRALEQNRGRRETRTDRQAIESRLAELTPREREVLELVVVGKANKVIAAELGISQRTVEIHRARVMQKMHADSLSELVRMVMQVRGGS